MKGTPVQKNKKGISKNVPHAYIQSGVRYYALMREVETTTGDGDEVFAFNFYVFDEMGYLWLQMTHTMQSFIYKLGNGLFLQRPILIVDDATWDTRPIVDSDTWINGSADRGYAMEIIRENLGLNFECLTALMEPDLDAEISPDSIQAKEGEMSHDG